jgi:hypothetical protein
MKILDLIMGETPEELEADAGMTLTRVYWRGNTPIQTQFRWPACSRSLDQSPVETVAAPRAFMRLAGGFIPADQAIKNFFLVFLV